MLHAHNYVLVAGAQCHVIVSIGEAHHPLSLVYAGSQLASRYHPTPARVGKQLRQTLLVEQLEPGRIDNVDAHSAVRVLDSTRTDSWGSYYTHAFVHKLGEQAGLTVGAKQMGYTPETTIVEKQTTGFKSDARA